MNLPKDWTPDEQAIYVLGQKDARVEALVEVLNLARENPDTIEEEIQKLIDAAE